MLSNMKRSGGYFLFKASIPGFSQALESMLAISLVKKRNSAIILSRTGVGTEKNQPTRPICLIAKNLTWESSLKQWCTTNRYMWCGLETSPNLKW